MSDINIKYILTPVTTKEQLDKFYKEPDLCAEGLTTHHKQWLGELADIIVEEYGASYPIHMFYFNGKFMNETYDLEGDNAYNYDFPFLSILTKDFPNIDKAIQFKLDNDHRFRWFNDIVDNNEYKEFNKGRHKYSEQIEWLYELFEKEGIRQRSRD